MNSDGEKIYFNIFILAELLNSLCTAKVIVHNFANIVLSVRDIQCVLSVCVDRYRYGYCLGFFEDPKQRYSVYCLKVLLYT